MYELGYLLFVTALCVKDQSRGCQRLPAILPEHREVATREPRYDYSTRLSDCNETTSHSPSLT